MVLVDCLGAEALLGVEFTFCNARGAVGMASTVLVVRPLGFAAGEPVSTGTSCGTLRNVELLEFCLIAEGLGLMKLLFLLRIESSAVSTM